MDSSARIGLAVLSLVLLWVVVYWITDAPERQPVEVMWGAQGEPLDAAGGAEPAAGPIEPAGPAPMPIITTPAPEPPPEQAPAPEPIPGDTIIPPRFRNYTVQKGDNASSIAEKEYGDRGLFHAVMRANPKVDFNRLRAGRVIKIAVDPYNIQGVRADRAGTPAPPEVEYTIYIVSKNDTLSGIAKIMYGRSGLWMRIRDANLDKVNQDGTNIRPGMELKIPPPP